MEYIYAVVLALVVFIGLYIVYNPQCLEPYGVEHTRDLVDYGKPADTSYELPY